MSVRRIKAGTVDVSVTLRIVDSTDGTPETGVVFNTSGIDLWYRRDLAASVDITEATLAALTTAHTDGGFLHINDGWYRLDLPDAACATGVPGVQIGGTVTGMVVYAPYIELPVNTEEDVYGRVGAPAGASVSADIAAVKVDTAAILVDTGTTLDARIPAALVGGRMDANVGAISSDATAADNAEAFFDGTGYAGTNNVIPSVTTVTGNVNGSVGSVTGAVGSVTGAVGSVTGNVGGNVTGSIGSLAAQAKADVNAEVDSALDTAVPAVPTANSINERIKTMDDADLPGDVAAVKTDTAAILADTGTDGVIVVTNNDKTGYSIGAGGIADTAFAAGAINAAAIAADAIGASELAADAIGASELAQGAAQEIADEVLNRDIAGSASGGARNVRSALRRLRNRVAIAAGTATVYQEDDATAAWTAAVTTAAGDPVSETDPA